MLTKIEQPNFSDKEFQQIGKTIYDHCGINLSSDKKEMVRSRLVRLLQKHGCSSYAHYLDVVLNDNSGEKLTEMVNRISTNLTSFFREKHHFDFLRDTVIPSLVARKGPPRIRAWSAGCSSGEEPYSIAITAAEALPNIHRANIKILASDISTRVLSTASLGCYPHERIEDLDRAMQNKYFLSQHDHSQELFQIRPNLRKLIIFKKINLMEKWPVTTPLDFIFCRNVMIYFDRETKERLVQRFSDQLHPGGWLFIGHSESLSNIKHNLKYVGPTIYEKQ